MNNAAQLAKLLLDLTQVVQAGQTLLSGPLFTGKDISEEELNSIAKRAASSVNNLRAVIRAKRAEQE